MAKPIYREVKRQITRRDFEILKFLWRWKILSTHAIARKFFPGVRVESAHARLRCLAEVGYIELVHVDKKCFAWSISKRGFKHLMWFYLHEEIHEGYKSEYPHHDYLTTAFHLGEWLLNEPTKYDPDEPSEVELYSEQELRCTPDEHWPKWIPQSTEHRPDGYTRFRKGEQNVVVAFETELTLKSKSRYADIVCFYEYGSGIDFVLWLVGTTGMANSIRRIFERYGSKNVSKHNFIVLEDFLKSGWDAKIIKGHFAEKAIKDLLPIQGNTEAKLWHHDRSVQSFLETKVCSVISGQYAPTENP